MLEQGGRRCREKNERASKRRKEGSGGVNRRSKRRRYEERGDAIRNLDSSADRRQEREEGKKADEGEEIGGIED